MGFGNRAFLVDEDDTVHKFSYSKLDRFLTSYSQESLPEMATAEFVMPSSGLRRGIGVR